MLEEEEQLSSVSISHDLVDMCGHVSGEGGCVLTHTKTRRRASHHVLSVLWELLPPPPIWSPPFIKEKSDTVVGRTREKSGCVMG